jgi:hypothetical protein
MVVDYLSMSSGNFATPDFCSLIPDVPALADNFPSTLHWKRHGTASCSFKMISFSNIDEQNGKQLLFVDASFQLNSGEKVGGGTWGQTGELHPSVPAFLAQVVRYASLSAIIGSTLVARRAGR